MSLHRVDNDGNYEPGKALCKPPIVVVVARAKQEQAEQEWREQQAREAQQFATSCNDLAGNPNDQHRRSEGVSYDHLKTQIPEAIRVCELAVQKFPEDLTLQYQLARAVELVDPARGQRMQDKLVKLGYPAAFDNAGSLLLNEKGCRQHCINEAVKLFRKGVALGDPDAMMSLADQIGQNHATGDQISLYQRAAKLARRCALLSPALGMKATWRLAHACAWTCKGLLSVVQRKIAPPPPKPRGGRRALAGGEEQAVRLAGRNPNRRSLGRKSPAQSA